MLAQISYDFDKKNWPGFRCPDLRWCITLGEICTNRMCKSGEWSAWTAQCTTPCSKTCGGGICKRTRQCFDKEKGGVGSPEVSFYTQCCSTHYLPTPQKYLDRVQYFSFLPKSPFFVSYYKYGNFCHS